MAEWNVGITKGTSSWSAFRGAFIVRWPFTSFCTLLFSYSQNLQVCVSNIFPLKGFSWTKLGSSGGGGVQLPARRKWGEVLCFPVTHFHIFSCVLWTGHSDCTLLFAAAEHSMVTTGSALASKVPAQHKNPAGRCSRRSRGALLYMICPGFGGFTLNITAGGGKM